MASAWTPLAWDGSARLSVLCHKMAQYIRAAMPGAGAGARAMSGPGPGHGVLPAQRHGPGAPRRWAAQPQRVPALQRGLSALHRPVKPQGT